MTSTGNSEKQQKSFIRDLVHRRVPQILGIYIGASWGVIQFTDWVVNRYMLSPYLTDLAFIILVSLIPSSMIVAYYHGRPGRDSWVKTEKLGIPANVILTVLLVVFFTSGKDLGPVSEKVTVQDETGKQTERIIPKTTFRKKILAFYFDNKTGDKSLDWLQYGLTYMLGSDLSQDLFFEITDPTTQNVMSLESPVYKQIKDTGNKAATGVPLTLKKKIAHNTHMEYFLSGDFSKQGETLTLQYSLHRARNAKTAAEGSVEGTDVFALVDALSLRLKKDLEIPKAHMDEVGDLPVAEIFTGSLKAARLYTEGLNAMVFDNDWSGTEKRFEAAVKEDPEFAVAYNTLGFIYLVNNRSEARLKIQEKAMQFNYKLSERDQLYAKMAYYDARNEADKSLAILRMIIKLYPEDLKAHSVLARMMEVTEKQDEAVAIYRRILELDPQRFGVFKKIGALYQLRGDFKNALDYYRKYTDRFPDKPESFKTLGGLYREMNDYAKAVEQYEQALLLEPDDIEVRIILAQMESDLGRFDKAGRQLDDALAACKTAKDRAAVYGATANLYNLTGRVTDAYNAVRKNLETIAEYQAPLVVKVMQIISVDSYAAAGKEKEAFQLLETLAPEFSPPFDSLVHLGYVLLYLKLENPAEAEKWFAKIDQAGENTAVSGLEALVRISRARLLEQQDRHAEAASHYEELFKKYPTRKGLLRRAARCYRNLEQYDKAEKYLKEALAANPGGPKNHYELGRLYLDKNDTENAKKHLTAALETWKKADPFFKPAKKAAEHLKALGKE